MFLQFGGAKYNFSKVELSRAISNPWIRAVWKSNTG